MPSQEELDEIRARFEASRCFEDDDEWLFTSRSTATSRRSTLTKSTTTTTAKKPAPIVNPALKNWAVQAAKKPRSKHRARLEPSKMKWEQTPSWEPSSASTQEQKDQEYDPGQVSGYGIEKGESSASWMGGWRYDEYGRQVKVLGGEMDDDTAQAIERVHARIAIREGKLRGE
jgi:hypothetical protein